MVASVAALLAATGLAMAQTAIKVGKANPVAFNFMPLDVGMTAGIFKKHNVDAQKIDFAGSARLQQALAAGAIDIGLGAGPEFASLVKGSPAISVGQLAGKPSLLGIIVNKDSPIKSAADLKGKKISVSTAGSLTQWLVRELSRRQGFGPTGIEAPPLGADAAQIAAMRTKQVDGVVIDLATAYQLEERGEARLLLKFGDIVDHFIIMVIWAHKDFVAKNPDEVRNFLAGWYESIAYMKANKQKTVDIIAPLMNVSPAIAARTYDELMDAMSSDGKFDPQGLEVLAASFPELGLLDTKPDLTKYINTSFLPGAK